ncbi:MAG: hypothetical protein JWM90_1529 [Thermoleophilia bacterium]|nr:hypothetical protein [Thermoleophilia bacterium]
MNDPIEPDEFTATLLHELARASEQGARGLHVQVTVPPESAYSWDDGEGVQHQVHLPTRIKVSLMRFLGEPHEDGGPAAVFAVDAGGHLPSEQLIGAMAEQLYRECIRWGRIRHVRDDEGDSDVLPRLPPPFEAVVAAAIFSDVR